MRSVFPKPHPEEAHSAVSKDGRRSAPEAAVLRCLAEDRRHCGGRDRKLVCTFHGRDGMRHA